MSSEYINAALGEIREHEFVLYKVTKSFTPNTSFKKAALSLTPITLGTDDKGWASVLFRQLFTNKHLMKSIPAFMQNCNKVKWTDLSKLYEKPLLVELGKKLLIPLFGPITYESDYERFVHCKNWHWQQIHFSWNARYSFER